MMAGINRSGGMQMCGRYTLTVERDELAPRFGLLNVVPDYRPRFNAAPGQYLPVIIAGDAGPLMLMMKWGLVPFWAKESSIGNHMINARIETLAEKPAFRRSFYHRRCLVPADGYYEWKKQGRRKQPLRIASTRRNLLSLAGLWDEWQSPGGEILRSFAIVTINPVSAVAGIHDRMPLILRREQEKHWLEGFGGQKDAASDFLNQIQPFDELEAYEVSERVNSPRNDEPELLDPLNHQGSLF